MTEKPDYQVGDIVKLKKPHPCGSSEWEILRVGADFRLKCTGCGHQIMVARRMVEKNTRGLKKSGGEMSTNPRKKRKKGLHLSKTFGKITIRDILNPCS